MKNSKVTLLAVIFMVSCFVGAYYSINKAEIKGFTKNDMQTYFDAEFKNIKVFANALNENKEDTKSDMKKYFDAEFKDVNVFADVINEA